MQGKILKGIGGFYYVHDGLGRVYECRAKGVFRSRDEKPLVGDDVEFSVTEEEPNVGRIDTLLPRRSELIRPAVANVVQAVILVTAARPAFHPVLLDRFLMWMEQQNVPSLIVVNKTDLDREGKGETIASIYRPAGYTVLSVSARTGEGLEALREHLLGKTTVLAGASGVGKSSVLNALIPGAATETGQLSRKLGRGRHTTRHSEIFFLTEHSFVLDTPGFTSLSVPDADPSELAGLFPEFRESAAHCFFPDCRHIGEPDCAVKRALAEGKIAESRYQSYVQAVQEQSRLRKY